MGSPTNGVIFVDEAGDPGLSEKSIRRGPYFVIGFVYCVNPSELRKRLRRFLRKQHLKNTYPPHLGELKFYIPNTEMIQQGYTKEQLNSIYSPKMPTIRTNAIGLICKHCDGVFAAVVDKTKARKTWTNEELGNFAFAETLIVEIMNRVSPPNPPLVVFDKGRLSPARTQKFKSYLLNKDSYFEFKGYKEYRGSLPVPIDMSSVDEPGLWAADMVAGSFYHKYSNNDSIYANGFRSRYIGPGERLYWK